MNVTVTEKTSYIYKLTLEDFNEVNHVFEINTEVKVEEKDIYRLLLSSIREIIYDFSKKSLKIYDKDNLVQIKIPLEFNENDTTYLIRVLMETYNVDRDLKSRKLSVTSVQGISCLIAVLFNETILMN